MTQDERDALLIKAAEDAKFSADMETAKLEGGLAAVVFVVVMVFLACLS